MIITSKDSVAARNRFIYYPDHLVKMPGPGQDLWQMLWTILTEPAFKGAPRGLLSEFSRPPRASDLEDESIGAFFDRRFGGPGIANNIISAVLHGIYAGDVYKLSIKSLAPRLWSGEATHQSLTQMMVFHVTNPNVAIESRKDAQLTQELMSIRKGSLPVEMERASVYTFKDGIGRLSDALASDLHTNPNVMFKQGYRINSVDLRSGNEAHRNSGTIACIP